MPGNDELFEQKKNRQLDKQVRIASDHRAGTLKQRNRNLYDMSAIRNDMQEIDEVLKGNLTSEDRGNLEVIKGRNMSSLLVLEEKTSGDSKQMKKVKNLFLRFYHIRGLKYILVTVIAVALIGFLDENSVWKHMMNRRLRQRFGSARGSLGSITGI